MISSRKVHPAISSQHLQQDAVATDYDALALADTGLALDAETQTRMFKPSFTAKAAGKGTSLGHLLVLGIVQPHNAYLEVDSAVGHDTTFHTYWPVAEVDLYHKQLTPLLPHVPLTGEETILLVEDEEQIRGLASMALQEAGYTVLVAANGQDALTVARHHGGPIHLLLTDVIMPGMNGAQLNEQMDTLYPSLKTLYISGYVDSKLAFPRLESTIRAAYLPKPFTSTVLTQKVREVLDT